jgi:hypothetical protein
LPVIALTPITPLPAITATGTGTTATAATTSTVIMPTDPQTPLGDNTPSPEIQNVIEKLRILAKQRK